MTAEASRRVLSALIERRYRLSWISDAPEKQADATGHVLNSVNKWTIDFHFDRRRWRRHQRTACHHHHGRRGGCFGPFFVKSDEGFVKDVRNIEIIVGFPWRDL